MTTTDTGSGSAPTVDACTQVSHLVAGACPEGRPVPALTRPPGSDEGWDQYHQDFLRPPTPMPTEAAATDPLAVAHAAHRVAGYLEHGSLFPTVTTSAGRFELRASDLQTLLAAVADAR
jgi:hypothetical protein